MSAIKRYYEDYIDDLSKKSGYTYIELMDIFNEVMDECIESDEEFDEENFTQITMEHDW